MDLNEQAIAEVLQSGNLFATTGLLIEAALYGKDEGLGWLDWDPATVQMELEQHFRVPLRQSVLDRIMLAHRLRTSDEFYKSVPAFVEACNVLSGSAFDPRVFDPADAAEMSWGVLEAALIAPPEEDPPFTEDILVYIGKALDEEGIITPPRALAIAVRDADVSGTVATTFAEDPEFQSGIMQIAAERTAEIDELLTARLRALLAQVDAVGLKTTDGRPMSAGLLEVMKEFR